MTTDQQVGRRVHQLMWDRRLKQTELGAVLGVTQTSVSRKLRGTRPWTIDELIAVAGWLRVSVTDLLPEGCAVRDSNPEPADYVLAA